MKELLWDLITTYLIQAQVFVWAHMVVMVLVFSMWRTMAWQRKTAEEWRPLDHEALRASRRKATEVTQLLDDFTSEAAAMGERGVVVPMTDYSDRIDSIVSGMTSSLHDRIHMFLLVGIAGTLAGIFEFASAQELALASVDDIARELGGAMAKAFPVGFVGLVLMLLAQIWSPVPEGRLHSAIAKATSLALKNRVHLVTAPNEALETLAMRVELALAPVRDLQSTLGESLNPVLSTLSTHLDGLTAVMKTEFARFDQRTADFAESNDRLTEMLDNMTEATLAIRDLLKRAPKVLEQSARLQSGHEDVLATSREVLERSVAAAGQIAACLTAVRSELAALPQSFVQATHDAIREAFAAVGLQSEKYWRDSFATLREDIQNELASYVAQLRTTASEVAMTLTSAGEEMRRLAESSNAVVEGPVRAIIKEGKTEIIDVLDRIGQLLETAAPAAERLTQLTAAASDAIRKLESRASRPEPDRRNMVWSGDEATDRIFRSLERSRELLTQMHSAQLLASESWYRRLLKSARRLRDVPPLVWLRR